MPWGEKTLEQLREQFVKEVLSGELPKSKVCEKYGISRVTGDKWLERYTNGQSLANQSRIPFHTPKKTILETENKIICVRKKHPAWGARKIIRYLENSGVSGLPAQSTVCEILKRNGLVSVEASGIATPYKRFEREQPNELWQTDFKGHFGMLNGQRCHPLTVLDDHSRFSLCVDAKENERYDGVAESFTRLFRTFGLPDSVLCDNGNPWGTSQSTGYTRFEVWFMDLNILPIHGRPLHPQTQGKDERFNRTLKTEALKGVEIKNLDDAQQRFNEFRECYNTQRPHEALSNDTPSQHYAPSSRAMPNLVEPWDYPEDCRPTKVKSTGYIRVNKQGYFLSEAFGNLTVAVRPSQSDGHCVNILYRNFWVARINVDERVFQSRRIFRRKESD